MMLLYRSRHGVEKDGSQNIYGIPVFGVRDGKFTSHYSRTYVEAAQELDSVPEIPDAQWEALDLLAEVAEEVTMEMMFEPGDIQLINNHVIYHARTAYEDAPQGEAVASSGFGFRCRTAAPCRRTSVRFPAAQC